MPIQALLPYLAAAYGGYKGYQGAKDSGASGLQRILGGLTGAYTGYTLGNMVPGTVPYSQLGTQYGSTMPFLKALPGQAMSSPFLSSGAAGGARLPTPPVTDSRGSIIDILLKKKKDGKYTDAFDPLKISALAAGVPYIMGAFDNQPTDIYMPGYNMGYLEMRDQRPGFTYIDPTTGQEKAYEKIYAPEEQGRGDPRMGPYSLAKTRLKTGGLAEIRKFNQGGINYLPSKVSHDENDSNNYVRAQGYVEDGSGNGDKDEDTMLAQLADGEFVTRADGVLGAGIIAGANPNSMKDMREKGAKYFYEQQKRFKRIFDLIEEKNGNSKQKTN